MAAHIDIPTRSQVEQLLGHRAPASVSVYLPTSRTQQEGSLDRLTLAKLADAATGQLRGAGVAGDAVAAIGQELADLAEDDFFWMHQADSLAVFVTPENLRAYRLPNDLTETVEVSDRFHVKPLLRALTFPHAAHVLALAKGAVRLLEIGPDGPPEELDVPGLPTDAWDPRGNRVFRAHDRNYVRQVDRAVHGVVGGSDLPLILAATETIDALYRTVNSSPHLADRRWPGNPEATSDADLAAGARTILDDVYAAELRDLAALFDARLSQGRTATDVAEVARLATIGAVDTLFVDIDETVPGTVDETTGAVTFADGADADSHGILDEIARRVYLASGRVLAVRRADIPGGGPVAAILRYAPFQQP